MKKIIPFFFFLSLFLVFFAGVGPAAKEDAFEKARKDMVKNQILARGITSPSVISAMEKVPRHRFVPASSAGSAYGDHPLPIGEGQTISQPYIVALMTESLELTGEARVLEIGTGSGYQAAVLGCIAKEVFSMEIREKLHEQASRILATLYPGRVKTRAADGYFGWKDAAPFDCIMITAAIDHIPPPLLDQLKDGGRLILPMGNPFSYQNLVLVTKKGKDFTIKQVTGVLFVPMTGQAMGR